MRVRISIFISFVFHASGQMRLLRKTYTNWLSGSTQAQVPVKPVWPYTEAGADSQHGLLLLFFISGLSNPNPLRLIRQPRVVNNCQVALLR